MMKILLLGATGFLGRHICALLLKNGFLVVAAVRDIKSAQRRFPGIEAIRIDLNRMTKQEDWSPYLAGIDAVVNAAGILQSSLAQSAAAIHTHSPKALFDACRAAGVKKLVQISAVSADAEAATEYALTKKAADDYLRSLDLDWTLLRPSLVYAQGSFGGTSALRGLAGFPLVMPMPGNGRQTFQPIHAEDLAQVVICCLTRANLARRTLDPVGPDTLSLREIVLKLRAWLDLPAVPVIPIPLTLIYMAARCGDALGRGALRSTAIDQMLYGNVSDATGFAADIGFQPRRLDDALRNSPSHVQDRWQARLYWLRPCLAASLAILWIGSGLVSLVHLGASARIAAKLGIHAPFSAFAAAIFALVDIAIGAGVILDRPRHLAAVQFLLVAGYSIIFSIMTPSLLLDPLGPLLKNLPILAAIAVWAALRDDK
jgi:uncharacterized protein YbjT (DUF2867 family)